MKHTSNSKRRDERGAGPKPSRATEMPTVAEPGEGLEKSLKDAVEWHNTRFYQERVLAYGSWRNFLDAHSKKAAEKGEA